MKERVLSHKQIYGISTQNKGISKVSRSIIRFMTGFRRLSICITQIIYVAKMTSAYNWLCFPFSLMFFPFSSLSLFSSFSLCAFLYFPNFFFLSTLLFILSLSFSLYFIFLCLFNLIWKLNCFIENIGLASPSLVRHERQYLPPPPPPSSPPLFPESALRWRTTTVCQNEWVFIICFPVSFHSIIL